MILCATLSTSAQSTHCIRAGATGTQSGSTWTDAYTNIPATLVRGDTYYIAAGSYGAYTFASVAGTSYIYLKKATVAVHGSATGWDDSYTNQVTFTLWPISSCHYLDIDGVTGDGFGDRGIKVSYSSLGQDGTVEVNANFVNIRSVEIAALDTQPTENQSWPVGCNQVNHDWLFTNCNFSGGCVGFQFSNGGGCSNLTVDHCYFSKIGSVAPQHSAGMSLSGIKNTTIRYCVFKDPYGNQFAPFIEPQGAGVTVGLYVYGNIFEITNGVTTSEGPLWFTQTGDYGTEVYFYNNTIYGMGSGIACGVGGNLVADYIHTSNNIWQACAGVPLIGYYNGGSPVNSTNAGSNILNTGEVAFVSTNTATFNLHLASDTSAGATLSATYGIDPDGVVRGTNGVWSKGAFQYLTNSIATSKATLTAGGTGAILIVTTNGNCTLTF